MLSVNLLASNHWCIFSRSLFSFTSIFVIVSPLAVRLVSSANILAVVFLNLSRSQPKVDDAIAEGNLTKKNEFLQDVRHAKSCFIVVLCFVILHYLPVISLVSFKHGKTLKLHYYHE